MVAALADFFGVARGYFFTASVTSGDVQIEDAGIVERLDDPARKDLLRAWTVSPRRRWSWLRVWRPNSASPMIGRWFLWIRRRMCVS